jgi:hypothetical protein
LKKELPIDQQSLSSNRKAKGKKISMSDNQRIEALAPSISSKASWRQNFWN